jgi:hypothetical protein
LSQCGQSHNSEHGHAVANPRGHPLYPHGYKL